MKITTKGRYALRMLVDITLHQSEGYVSLKDISDRQDISKKYLEQIVPLLNKSHIIKTSRGNRGGYKINGDPKKLTIGEVLRATEGSLAPVACLDYQPNECERVSECATLPIWEGLYKLITDYLDGISIKDVADKCGTSGDHYCI